MEVRISLLRKAGAGAKAACAGDAAKQLQALRPEGGKTKFQSLGGDAWVLKCFLGGGGYGEWPVARESWALVLKT